jgi:hypothetical protein
MQLPEGIVRTFLIDTPATSYSLRTRVDDDATNALGKRMELTCILGLRNPLRRKPLNGVVCLTTAFTEAATPPKFGTDCISASGLDTNFKLCNGFDTIGNKGSLALSQGCRPRKEFEVSHRQYITSTPPQNLQKHSHPIAELCLP